MTARSRVQRHGRARWLLQAPHRVAIVAGVFLIALLGLIILLAPEVHQTPRRSIIEELRFSNIAPATPPTDAQVRQGRASQLEYSEIRVAGAGCRTFDGTSGVPSVGDIRFRFLKETSSTNSISEFSPIYRDNELRFFPKDSLVSQSRASLRLVSDSLHVVATTTEIPSGADSVDSRFVCEASDFTSESNLAWGFDLGTQGAGKIGIKFSGIDSPTESHDPSKLKIGVNLSFPKKSKFLLYGLASRGSGVQLSLPDEVQLMNLDVNHYKLDRHSNLYGSVPLVYATDLGSPQFFTVGILWLNGSPTKVRTSANPQNGAESIEFTSDGGAGRLYIFPGPTSADVLRQYFALTGFPMLPPIFGIGYHQCRWSYRDQADVEDVNSQFDAHRIPADTIWLDIDHTNDRRYFTWDGQKFPNSLSMIASLTKSGRRLVTISDPHIKADPQYWIYKEAQKNRFFVTKGRHTTDDFHGHCWPGDSSWIDFANPAAREWYSKQFHPRHYVGSSLRVFTWIDMNEPSVFSGPDLTLPMDAGQTDGKNRFDHRQLHNMYGFYHSAATFAGHLHRSDNRQRPFLLTRSFFAGSQRFAAVWTGDNQAQWSHLHGSIAMLNMHSLSGIVFIGADVGGFFDDPDEELHVRWFQLGSIYPFFRGHSHEQTRRREPWLFNDAVRENIANAIRLRYTLLPYLYTIFHAAHSRGSSIWRPRVLEFPNEAESYALLDADESIMVGGSILAIPALHKGQRTTSTKLPNTAFVNFWTGEGLAAGSHVSFPIPSAFEHHDGQAVLPLLLRAGSVIPVLDKNSSSETLSTEKMGNEGIELLITMDSSCSARGSMYHDDGETTEFAQGSFCERNVAVSLSQTGSTNHPTLIIVVSPLNASSGLCTDEQWRKQTKDNSLRFSHITTLTVHAALCQRLANTKLNDRIVADRRVWQSVAVSNKHSTWTFALADPMSKSASTSALELKIGIEA